jgi:hypothetical protein
MAAGRLSRNFAIFAFLALTAEDGRAQQYSLVGNWEANVTLNGFPITSEASLRQDGSFTMNAQSNPGLEFNVDGTYTVSPAAQTIRFINRDWEPKEECLPGLDFEIHCTTLPVPQVLDAHYRFLSPDMVVLESPGLDTGPVQYQRTQ